MNLIRSVEVIKSLIGPKIYNAHYLLKVPIDDSINSSLSG